VAHNAPFDVGFLESELSRCGRPMRLAERCHVLDTLALAREMHPGQRNSLDALCKRYNVDNSGRELHGALLDARILADVYLAMTGGQATLELSGSASSHRAGESAAARPTVPLRVLSASAEELRAHEEMLTLISRSSAGRCLWCEPDMQARKDRTN